MKNIFLSILLGLSSLASAQETKTIPYVNSNQVVGAYNVGMTSALLLNEGHRGMDKKDIYVLRFMNETVPAQELCVNQGSQLFAVENCEKGAAFIWKRSEETDLIFIRPNAEPTVTEIKKPANFNSYGLHETGIHPDGSLTLFMGYSIYGKDRRGKDSLVEAGHEIISLTADGQISNRVKQVAPGQLQDRVVSVFPTTEGITFLLESYSLTSKQFELKLILCDKKGNITGKRVLSNANTFLPSGVVYDNQNFVLSGYYLKGSIHTARNSEGLFVEVIKADGSLVAANTYDWDKLKSKMTDNSRSDFIFNGKMKVMIEKISPTESGYRIIGESYAYGSGITPAEMLLSDNSVWGSVLTVYDFIVFETNETGEITSVNILNCEPSNIEIGSGLRGKGAMQVTNTLKRYQVLPYKGLTGNKIQFVHYKKGEGFYSEMDVVTGDIKEGKAILLKPVIAQETDKDLEALKAKSGAINALDNFSKKTEKLSENLDDLAEKATYGVEKIDRHFSFGKADSGYLILPDSHVITYLINKSNYTVYYEYLN